MWRNCCWSKVDVRENDGRTPLYDAATGGHKDVAELLLPDKADPNARDYSHGLTPLHWASHAEKGVAEVLLAHKAEVNAINGETPLHVSCEHVAKLLLAKGADVDAGDKDGRTLLHWAAFKEREGPGRIAAG
jgi:ankyrin repeat protein